jgi:hypothetical protein
MRVGTAAEQFHLLRAYFQSPRLSAGRSRPAARIAA